MSEKFNMIRLKGVKRGTREWDMLVQEMREAIRAADVHEIGVPMRGCELGRQFFITGCHQSGGTWTGSAPRCE